MRSVRQADRRQSNRTDATDANVRGVRIKTFFSGVMALSLSTALVKVIGLFYKIPMLRYLTSVGMGYFNAAYEWYAMLSVLFTAGLPIAASMLIAQQISRALFSCFFIFFQLLSNQDKTYRYSFHNDVGICLLQAAFFSKN